jgi:release factor glutamine methyltransferase
MNENELILCDLLKCNRVDLYLKEFNVCSLNPKQLALFLELKRRREQGFPVQYLLGKCEFFGLEFKVRPGVFIPRPETEILVETAIAKTKDEACLPARQGRRTRDVKILDIGTGSGNIAISLARNIPNSKITAIDKSLEAIKLAKENAQLNCVADKIEFIQTDIFSQTVNCKPLTVNYDLIISNPPYIRTGDLESLPAEVKHEPSTALDGGLDGLDFYREILKISKNLLCKDGYLLFEIGLRQALDISAIVRSTGVFNIERIIPDYNKIERVMVFKKNNFKQ